VDELRRDLERFLPPGLVRYAVSDAERIDALQRELGVLERRHHTLALAWPLRGVLEGGGFLLPGTVLAGDVGAQDHPTHRRAAEVLLAALEEYNGRLLAWGAGTFLAFFPGVTASGSSTQANYFRACQTASELAELELPGLRQALTAGRGGLVVCAALERKLTVPVGGAVGAALTLTAAAEPGTIRLSTTMAEVVAERFQVVEGSGGPLLGTILSGRRVNKALVEDQAPVPPEHLLDRLAQAAAGMERARPWLAPWQLEPLGARFSGRRPLTAEAVLALAWPPPGESANRGAALEERLRVEAELCANWDGELWGLVPHPDGLCSAYAFPDVRAAGAAALAVLAETDDRGGAIEVGELCDHYLRGPRSSAAAPAGRALRSACGEALLAPTGELVCHPASRDEVEPEFEIVRSLEVADRPLAVLRAAAEREEAGRPLLGCGELLEKTDAWLEELRRGGSIVGVVTGGPGAGKSRACRELRDLFAELGDAHLFRCQSWWAYDPYSLWRRTLLAIWGPPASTAANRALREALGEAAPRLGEFISRFTGGELSEPLWGLSPRQKGQMAGELLLAALRAREGRPLALVIDDADWLDAGSLQLVRSLSAAGLPLAVILCCRRAPEELSAQYAELQPLEPDEAADLFADAAGRPGPFIERLPRRELVPGKLSHLAALAAAGADPALGARLSLERLGQELLRLEPDGEAPQLVSVLGPRFGAGDLAAVTDGVSELRRRLESSRLLERSGGEYAFRGRAVWQAAYTALEPRRRRELHFRAARFYQRQHRGVVAQAVAHFMNCGDPGERVTALELAGERAAAVGSFTAARRYLREAVAAATNRRDTRRLIAKLAAIHTHARNYPEADRLYDNLLEEAEEAEQRQAAELALDRAELQLAVGDPEMIERWVARAAALEPELDPPRRSYLLGEAAKLRGDAEAAREHLGRAAEAPTPEGARAAVRLGRLLLGADETAEALEFLRRAEAWARQQSHVALIVEAVRLAADAHAARGAVDEARAALEQALERERALLQVQPVAETLSALADFYAAAGERRRALDCLTEAEATFTRLELPVKRLDARERRAAVSADLGRIAVAREILEEVSVKRRGLRDRFGATRCALLEGRLAALQGDWRTANNAYDQALLGAREVADEELIAAARRGHAHSLLHQGRLAEFDESLGELEAAEAALLSGELYRLLYLFDTAAREHRRTLDADPDSLERRLALALDHLSAGNSRAGKRLLAETAWPPAPRLELELDYRRARVLVTLIEHKPARETELQRYRELAEGADAVVHRALAAKDAAAGLVLDGELAAARELIDSALTREPPAIVGWQLQFFAGLLAGRDGDAAARGEFFGQALRSLEDFRRRLPDAELQRRLQRSETYNALRRG